MATSKSTSSEQSDTAPVPDASAPSVVQGTDPDSVIRAAKHQLAAADATGDDRARDQLERAGKARSLLAERNNASADRVAVIDGELRKLGFDAEHPLPVSAQGEPPAGRSSRPRSTAT